MKKVIILGGGIAQLELIRTAKDMGLFTIVVGIPGLFPGYQIADKVYNIDILDKTAVLDIAKKENVDGISMVCSDLGLSTVGFVCEQLNLVGLTENSAKLCADKLAMKKRLMDNGIQTAKFFVINNLEDINQAFTCLKFPVMLKAVDLQGSKGVFKCNNKQEAFEKYSILRTLTRKSYCLVEEFIEGVEFGVQALIYNGKVVFIQPHGDIVLKKDSVAIPIGHFMPFTRDKSESEQIYTAVTKSIHALGLNNCAVNVDLISKDGTPYIIELTGRAGANGLIDLISSFFGLDYNKLILHMAVGDDPILYWQSRKLSNKTILSKQLISSIEGKLTKLEYINDSRIKKLSFFIREGEFVKKFTNSSDCVGKVLCEADNLNDCKKIISDFEENNLKLEIN